MNELEPGRLLAEAQALLRAGRPGDALTRCEQVLARRGGDSSALQLSGLILYSAGRIGEAIERLERATRAAGADGILWSNLALAYDAAGRRESAARARAEGTPRPARP